MNTARDLSAFGSATPKQLGDETDLRPDTDETKPKSPAPRRNRATAQPPRRDTTAATLTALGPISPDRAASPTRQLSSAPKQHKRRINLSLPVAVADALRRYSQKQSTYYVDVILRAHALHGKTVLAQFEATPGTAPRLRHRKPLGRVQVALTIKPEMLAAIDRDAELAGLDRSAFVAELLALTVGDGGKR